MWGQEVSLTHPWNDEQNQNQLIWSNGEARRGRERGREGGREREEGREGGREGGRKEGREGWLMLRTQHYECDTKITITPNILTTIITHTMYIIIYSRCTL